MKDQIQNLKQKKSTSKGVLCERDKNQLENSIKQFIAEARDLLVSARNVYEMYVKELDLEMIPDKSSTQTSFTSENLKQSVHIKPGSGYLPLLSGIKNVGMINLFFSKNALITLSGNTCYLNSVLQCLRPFIASELESFCSNGKMSNLVHSLNNVFKDGKQANELVDYLEKKLQVSLRVPTDAGVKKQEMLDDSF